MSDEPRTTSAGVCVIVGAGMGLGSAVARRFAREGYDIALFARNPRRLQSVRAELAAHVRVLSVRVDAGDESALTDAFTRVVEELGPVTVLVYNAADMTPDAVDELGVEELLSAMRTDVGGALASIHAVLPAMRTAASGTILLTGGGLALEPYPEWASLAAGKAALRSVGLGLHKQLKPHGVHVAVVAVCGIVAQSGPFASDAIADIYWEVHRQPIGRAQREVVYLPAGADPFYNDPDRRYRDTSSPIRPVPVDAPFTET
ncbi:SDR family oxidoreductase [Williamsia sterculiae]|nr:SDR family NAD(P)-dependent oxidoreductase [Williamsia sterculiae]